MDIHIIYASDRRLLDRLQNTKRGATRARMFSFSLNCCVHDVCAGLTVIL